MTGNQPYVGLLHVSYAAPILMLAPQFVQPRGFHAYKAWLTRATNGIFINSVAPYCQRYFQDDAIHISHLLGHEMSLPF